MKKQLSILTFIRNVLVPTLICAWLLKANAGADFKKSSPERIAKGKELFKTKCASCHGDKGDGDSPIAKALNPPPRNLLKDPFKNKKKDKIEGIFEVITNGLIVDKDGKPTPTAMVGFKDDIKSDEDRWNIAHFVKSLRK